VDTNGEFALDTTSSNNITLQNGGTLSPNSGNQTLKGTLTLGTNGGNIALREWWSNSVGQNLNITQGITGSGGLTVAAPNGTSTLTLNGTNTYIGGTTVNSGVLTVAAGRHSGEQ
jgi:fibronectin-binding autotransporter adhesin